ncbi:MAG: hypothetical protein IKQ46_02430 [Bacteroidales bacterium]|nr:hypothetical protein [Bacteroidales bacterium]
MSQFIKTIIKFILIAIPIAITFSLPCIFILPYQTGGFGDWGIPFGPYDTIFKPVNYCYIENVDNYDSLKNKEIITIGDSFSQGTTMGYQNYLGHKLNKTISNFRIKEARPENTGYTLLKKNMIPKCKVLITESVERTFIKSLSDEFTIFDNIQKKEIITNNEKNLLNFFKPQDIEIKSYDFNFKKLLNYYTNKFTISKSYKKLKLIQPMFTARKYSEYLYIYNNKKNWDGDLLFQYLTENEIKKAKNNLNSLIEEAEKQNIKLIYMIPADKYDMYYDFIENNPYPPNPSFDYFKDLDTNIFVNTKQILTPYLKNGEKDIYRVNDTHWSIKAAKIVGEHLADIIINYNINNK